MAETLLSPSGVLLYGRVVEDLEFKLKKPSDTLPGAGSDDPPPRLGNNKFLQMQLEAYASTAGDARQPKIARIYAFSYEGHYYDLAKPALFLVHGPGVDAERHVPGVSAGTKGRAARAPDKTDRSGVAATPRSFSEDMQVWAYDKGDFSIRMDVETGTFEQILLDVEMSTDRLGMTFSGKTVRLRGSLGGGD